jgi:hypothetical protein
MSPEAARRPVPNREVEMDRDRASPSAWLVVQPAQATGQERILGAFDTLEDASEAFGDDDSVSIKRAPHFLARRRFVWGVVGPDAELKAVLGGDARRATELAMDSGGELRLFLDESPESPEGPPG